MVSPWRLAPAWYDLVQGTGSHSPGGFPTGSCKEKPIVPGGRFLWMLVLYAASILGIEYFRLANGEKHSIG